MTAGKLFKRNCAYFTSVKGLYIQYPFNVPSYNREFFERYPEIKIPNFYYGGDLALKLENPPLYKQLSRYYEEYMQDTFNGMTREQALMKSFAKFEDVIQLRIEEAKTTEVIAKSMRVKPLMNVLKKDSLLEGYHKMLRVQRDVGLDQMKDEIDNLEDFVGSVISKICVEIEI